MKNKEKTLILCPILKPVLTKNTSYQLANKEQETERLAAAIDLEVYESQSIVLSKIVPATFLGKGKITTLKDTIQTEGITLIIMNCSISPIQQRNLEKLFTCKVIDRTALILEIFGKRAQSKEGKLQVELAALHYQKSRLVRSWTHLERQRGGSGFLGGPGEKQIESDRRQINERIISLKKRLEKVTKTRRLQRLPRQKAPYKTIALVGYTNAGKSTLFNLLTGAQVLAKDMLFATLDPTIRIITLPSKSKVMLSDTVGFISDLPTELIAAFKATLEEVIYADIIIHVCDLASADFKEQRKDVLTILESLGLQKKIKHNYIEVYNKIDLLSPNKLSPATHNRADKIYISARQNKGIQPLLMAIEKKLWGKQKKITLTIAGTEGKLLTWLHENSKILSLVPHDEKLHITTLITAEKLKDFQQRIHQQEYNDSTP